MREIRREYEIGVGEYEEAIVMTLYKNVIIFMFLTVAMLIISTIAKIDGLQNHEGRVMTISGGITVITFCVMPYFSLKKAVIEKNARKKP